MPGILIADPSERARRATRDVLEHEGLDVVGSVATLQGALSVASRTLPDVALVDRRLLAVRNDVVQAIREASPATQVIVVVEYGERQEAVDAQQLGAYAYLVKGCPGPLARDVIERARGFAG